MTKLVRRLARRLHGQGRNRKKAVRASLGKLSKLLVLNAGKGCRHRRGLSIDEGLRTNREHLNIDLGCRHVLQPALQIPSTAGKMPIDVPGNLERGELVADVGELRPHLWRLALQQPDGIFG